MADYKYPENKEMAFKEHKLKKGELFGGHEQRMRSHLGFYVPNNALEIYNLMFDYTQEFNNDAERFMFEHDKLAWVKYKQNHNRELKLGNILCSIYNGCDSHNGGVRLKVTEITDRVVYFWDRKFVMSLDEWKDRALFLQEGV